MKRIDINEVRTGDITELALLSWAIDRGFTEATESGTWMYPKQELDLYKPGEEWSIKYHRGRNLTIFPNGSVSHIFLDNKWCWRAIRFPDSKKRRFETRREALDILLNELERRFQC